MAIENPSPEVLLLGGGYTLSQLAQKLRPSSFVITSRDREKVAQFRRNGWLAEQLDFENTDSVNNCLLRYPGLVTVVDSVPPRRTGDPAESIKITIPVFEARGIKQIIYLSTTGVYGVRDGSWVDESSATNANTPPGMARIACEQTYRRGSFSSLSLRLPAIVGPGRSTADSLRAGRYRIVEDGRKWTNRIHVEDLCRIIEAALIKSHLPDILCVGDDQPVQAQELVAFLCAELQLPRPSSVSEAELVEQGAYTMLSNQRVRNTKMKAELGVELLYPNFKWMAAKSPK